MNRDTQVILAHQVLLGADVFNDSKLGANKCPLCLMATLAKASDIAHLVCYDSEPLIAHGRMPHINDVYLDTPVDIVGSFSRTVMSAHSRHLQV